MKTYLLLACLVFPLDLSALDLPQALDLLGGSPTWVQSREAAQQTVRNAQGQLAASFNVRVSTNVQTTATPPVVGSSASLAGPALWGADRQANRLSLTNQIALAESQWTERQTALQIETYRAYTAAWLAVHRRQLAEREAQYKEAFLTQTRAAWEAGRKTSNDVSSALTQSRQAAASLSQAWLNQQQALAALDNLLGQSGLQPGAWPELNWPETGSRSSQTAAGLQAQQRVAEATANLEAATVLKTNLALRTEVTTADQGFGADLNLDTGALGLTWTPPTLGTTVATTRPVSLSLGLSWSTDISTDATAQTQARQAALTAAHAANQVALAQTASDAALKIAQATQAGLSLDHARQALTWAADWATSVQAKVGAGLALALDGQRADLDRDTAELDLRQAEQSYGLARLNLLALTTTLQLKEWSHASQPNP